MQAPIVPEPIVQSDAIDGVRHEVSCDTAAMNYRHSFHAGNFADVLKHVTLLGLIEAMQRKDKGFLLLDTHAGRGGYLLESSEAQRTGECEGGVCRVVDLRPLEQQPKRQQLDAAPLLRSYIDAVRAFNRTTHGDPHALRAYPGSPLLVAQRLRAQDRLHACELQPAEAKALGEALVPFSNARAECRDGYAAVKALLPPAERRALVLIDPPYEAQEAEFDAILASVRDGLQRLAQGVFAVWFPIKRRAGIQRFLRRATDLPAQSVLLVELLVRPDDSPLRMNGSGLLIINPPWQLDLQLAQVLPQLRQLLGESEPTSDVRWLKREL
jgi:23S rRNA (adenine2030-N6)-methyltransferase